MVIAITSQQFKQRNAVLISLAIANAFNAAHFLLLGAITGLALACIGAIRFWVATISTKTYWLVIFLTINTIATYIVFETALLSGTSYIAATFVIASSFLKNDNHMRIFLIIGTIGWLLYGILVGSIIAIIANSVFLGSGIIGWYRYNNKKYGSN